MKKLFKLSAIGILSCNLYAQNISITNGWQLLGAIEDVNVSKFDNSCVDYIWKYDNNGIWKVHIANSNYPIPSTITAIKSLNKAEGYWVKARSGCNIDTSNIDNSTTNSGQFKRIILKTAQIKSFAADGSEVSDGSIKDDGYYQKGTSRSYEVVNGNIKDNITGFLWQNDAAAYGDAKNQTKVTSEALSYCSNLSLDGKNDWRLPSAYELLDLVDYSEFNIALDDIFESMQYTNYATANFYWSSATKMSDDTTYYMVTFGEHGGMFSETYNGRYVRCVNGKEKYTNVNISDYFTRDDEKEVVVDSSTDLMWEDGSYTGEYSWIGAINFCEELSHGGYDDWRLPNINELRSIFDPSKKVKDFWGYRKMYAGFSSYMRPNAIWSSTSEHYKTIGSYYIDFYNGVVSRTGKGVNQGVRCVRDNK